MSDFIRRARDTTLRVDDPAIAALLVHAVDAAMSAGAVYADARYHVSDTDFLGVQGKVNPPYSDHWGWVSVRALYQGYWGYSARIASVPSMDEVATMGRQATAQAKISARGRPRTVELASAPIVTNGHWETPIEIDPFSVSWDEKNDVMNGFIRSVGYQRLDPFPMRVQVNYTRHSTAFASSEGSSYTQTLYRTGLEYIVGVDTHWQTKKWGVRDADAIATMSGAGWEAVLNAPLERRTPEFVAQANDMRFSKPVDVGRYDIVFDGAALAKLATFQLGAATELDRAMGYLANGAGTSYLDEPLDMLGNHQVGSPLLNVSANRSMPRGAATVQWDSEGVVPDEAVLVKDGMLTDFQTTRESASWLAPYYQKIGKPVRSHGGSVCDFPENAPQQGPHNLVVAPSTRDTSIDALCSGIKRGLAVFSGTSRADHQMLNADSKGDIVYEIRNGKLGQVVDGATLSTRAPELWKNLIGLGGPQTVCNLGFLEPRGYAHTVSAPAACFKQVAVTAIQERSL
jgi:TldD protein